MQVLTQCPWCGMTGPDFDESPKPADYCDHDTNPIPTLIEQLSSHGRS